MLLEVVAFLDQILHQYRLNTKSHVCQIQSAGILCTNVARVKSRAVKYRFLKNYSNKVFVCFLVVF